MDYIDQIFARMDLEQIRNFLLCGVEGFTQPMHSYKDFLKESTTPIHKRFEKIYKDDNELDEAIYELSNALHAYEYVYMNIGMKAGAKIVHQLLLANDDK